MRAANTQAGTTARPMTYGDVSEIQADMHFGAGRPARENAAKLERFFEHRARQSDGFLGADGVYSATSNGRTIFAFGDTFLGGRAFGRQLPTSRLNFLRSSLGIAEDGTFKIAAPPTRERLGNRRDWITPRDARIPLFGSKDWYWPGAMHTSTNGVHLLLNRYTQPNRDVMWGFRRLGTEVATLDPQTLALRSVTKINDDPDVIWGAASLATPDHLYMYGAARADDGAPRMKVARTTQLDASRGWEYLAADGSWSARPSDAALQDARVASQFSVIANPHGGVDLVVQDGFNPKLTVTHAATPAGPWEIEGARSFDLPAVDHPTYAYNAVVHESLSDADRLVVSVNQNTFSPVQLVWRPQIYRPHFFTMPRPGSAAFDVEQRLTWGT